MLTNLKLSTGALGLALKMRVIPAGNDMVRSPVILTRQLKHTQADSWVLIMKIIKSIAGQCGRGFCPPDGVKEPKMDFKGKRMKNVTLQISQNSKD